MTVALGEDGEWRANRTAPLLLDKVVVSPGRIRSAGARCSPRGRSRVRDLRQAWVDETVALATDGGDAVAVACDVSAATPTSERLVATKEYGRLDVMFNNAGIPPRLIADHR
jgi:NAD(P)-dependent dehydrogenase (short-subunit alcohol dehydrogenase family)